VRFAHDRTESSKETREPEIFDPKKVLDSRSRGGQLRVKRRAYRTPAHASACALLAHRPGNSFSGAEIHADTAEAVGRTTSDYTSASLRYDLFKLRAKRPVERLQKSRRYRLTAKGYLCRLLRALRRIYAPLISAILARFKDDQRLPETQPPGSIDSTVPS
jgi:hypothetical protein